MTAHRRRGATILLVVLGLVSAWSQEDTIRLEPPPGTYGSAVELRLQDESIVEYRFIGSDGTPHTDFFLPFDTTLPLGAPDGGEAVYRIEFVRGDARSVVEYRIDARPPAPPLPEPPPDLYTTDQRVVAASDEEARVFALTDTGRFRTVDQDNPVLITGEAGEIVDREIVVYAEDRVGNRSETRSYTYRIDRRAERPAPESIIRSPVAGTFANEQILLVDTTGLRDVRYTIDGARSESGLYRMPTRIDGEGTFSLAVTATEVVTGLERTERVEWTQFAGTASAGTTRTGMVTEDLRIDPPETEARYTLQDRPVRAIDPIQRDPLELRVTPDARRTVVLRRRPVGTEIDERSVFILDGRRPPPPRAVTVDGQVRLVGLADTEIVYLTGVREGDPGSAVPYTAPVDLPAGTDTDVTAWSRYSGGAWSAPLSTTLDGPRADVPLDEADLRWDGTTLTIQIPAGYRYRIGELSDLSASAPGVVRFRPPRGFDRTLLIEGGGAERSIPVDTAPPAPPVIEYRSSRVTISGEGELFYRIDGGAFQPYDQSLTLPGEGGVRIDYRIDAYRLASGEQSTIARASVPVDRRPLALPPFVEPVDESITNDGELELRFAGSYDDLQVHYELSYQGTPRIPTDSSPSTSSVIVVPTPDGEVRRWQLALRGRFVGRQGWTPVSRVSFVVDRVPPEAPVLVRPSAPVEASERFILEFGDTEEDTRLFYRLHEEQLFVPYDGPISVNAPESGSMTYRIEAYTQDPAGNRTPLGTTVTARLTSNRPSAPTYAVNGRAVQRSSVALNREAILSLESGRETQGTVYWRVFDDSDQGFTEYTEPYHLRMPAEGEERTIRVEAYRETPEGLRSPVSRITVVLDRSSPVQPPAPFVHRMDDGRRGLLIWPGGETRQVFVALDEAEEEVFVPTDGQVPWSIPAGQESLGVTYFTIDAAGNRSESGFLTIHEPEAVYVPDVFGVEDRGIYRSERTVELRSDTPVRYTVSLDGTSPPPVHPLSALYEEPLRFTASMNEEVTVRLRYRSQNSEGELSEEGTTTFTIDRQVPEQPVISGVTPDAYYPDTRRATLSSPGNDRILYRVVRDEENAPEYREYRGETIELSAVDGTLAQYTIEAYTVDPAGNRSDTVERWTVHVDREIVYVAADARADGTGTRSDPFHSVADAFATAAAEGRSTIFLTAGNYELSGDVLRRAVNAIDGLAIIGGFSTQGWAENAGTTVLEAPGGPMEMHGDLRVRSVTLRGGLRIAAGGTVELQNTTVRGSAATPAVFVAGSSVRITDSRLHGPVIVGEGATVYLGSSKVDEAFVDRGSLTIEHGLTGPIYGEGASVTIRAASMEIPRRPVRVPDGMESLPRINTAALVVVRNTELLVEESLLDASTGTGRDNATAISVEGGSTIIRTSTVRSRADGAALAIRQIEGDLYLEGSRLVSMGGRYSYAVVQRGGSNAMINSILLLDGGEEIVGIVGNGGTSTVVHSLLELHPAEESGIIQGIALNDSAAIYVVNSVISHEPGGISTDSPSTAIHMDPASGATAFGSLFAGWTRDLVQTTGPMRWSTRNTELRADRFSSGSYGSDNESTGGFLTGLGSSLLVEFGVSDLAATWMNGDLSLLADRGVALSRLPNEIVRRLRDIELVETDLRGVRRAETAPDIGPIEF